MKSSKGRHILVIVSFAVLLCSFTAIANAENEAGRRNVLAEKGFIHILGPGPVLEPNEEKAWDDWVLESCDIFKDRNTYYWYYHAQGRDKEVWSEYYQIGVAIAPTPLGPWKKYEKNPVLEVGAEGSWDSRSVDCVVVMKEESYYVRRGTEKYYMWYSGVGPTGRRMGLATATNALGPWEKYEGNPILEDFGFLGGVVKVDGKFYMYTQYPVTVNDNGPLCVATADKPEGPWKKYEGNPIIDRGDWGSWDAGGFSEARVKYHDGVFHCFYGDRGIGYAYSFDGFNFTKYGRNPLITLDRVPDASGLAEASFLIEPPFIYVYHTLKYISSSRRWSEDSWSYISKGLDWKESWIEHLGIQVLSIEPHFKIAMPVINIKTLGAKQTSRLQDCLPIGLQAASSLALETECTYDIGARAGLRLHVRASSDGVNYDTVDLYNFNIELNAGKTLKKTVELSPKSKFVKVIVENLDKSKTATSVNMTATLGK